MNMISMLSAAEFSKRNCDDEEPLYQGEAFYRGHKISFEIRAYGGGFYKWDLSGGDETWAEKYYNVR